jgi:imidazole glycerol-phosphate synthase subunit HisH
MYNIVIIDFGAGNIKSMHNALLRLDVSLSIKIYKKPDDLRWASHIILPGVGAFNDAMISMAAKPNLISSLGEEVLSNKKPFLGICLGMQILADYGYEVKKTRGLGWISGEIRPFAELGNPHSLKIPHMGWNDTDNVAGKKVPKKFNHKDFYFVHSYYFDCKNSEDVLSYANYIINFPDIISKDNIMATQFHPEKSGKMGQEFLKYFLTK